MHELPSNNFQKKLWIPSQRNWFERWFCCPFSLKYFLLLLYEIEFPTLANGRQVGQLREVGISALSSLPPKYFLHRRLILGFSGAVKKIFLIIHVFVFEAVIVLPPVCVLQKVSLFLYLNIVSDSFKLSYSLGLGNKVIKHHCGLQWWNLGKKMKMVKMTDPR